MFKSAGKTLPNTTRSHQSLYDFTRPYQALQNQPGAYHTQVDPTRSYFSNRTLPDPARPYQTLPDPPRSYQALQGPARLYQNLPDPTGPYQTHHTCPYATRIHQILQASTRPVANRTKATTLNGGSLLPDCWVVGDDVVPCSVPDSGY
jgi:hypothetical protein